jgi:Tfp pilus assembly protein PilN
MINLIPNKEKKVMMRGFYYRLLVLFLVIGCVSFVFLTVALLPTYFTSLTKNNIVKVKLEVQKNEPVSVLDQQTLSIIKDLGKKLDIVEASEKNTFLVSEKIINAVLVKKLSRIKITDLSYNNDPTKIAKGGQASKKISIKGDAPSREVLLAFREALEDSNFFTQVDLPISNFVKGSNIKFSLSLFIE